MMVRTILIVLMVAVTPALLAQYFQFSQYNFTPLRVNPALVASSDFATASLLYRNQGTEGGFNLTSNSLSATYPLISQKRGVRWGGLGIGFLDDRSGYAGIFSRQEASLAYAVNVSVSKRQSLSLGIRGLFQTTRINLDGLSTGLQYVADRGFNESISNGEGTVEVNNSFFTFSAGLQWLKTDKKDDRVMHVGISFFDINQPDNVFVGASDNLSTTVVGSGGFRLYKRGNVSLYPDFLITYRSVDRLANGGMITRYSLRTKSGNNASVDLITRYVVGRHGTLGLQFHQHNFSMGISYDLPLAKNNVANTGAVEAGIEIHRFKGKKRKTRITQKKKSPPPAKMKALSIAVHEKIDTLTFMPSLENESEMSKRLRHKQDSVLESAIAGELSHEPLILEKATLHVKFEFNSTDLDEESQQYFDDLAKALIDNPELRVQLEGHTDNVGSDRYNLRLSVYRAQSIKDYLVENGVEESRISVSGKGLIEPLNRNRNDEERAMNRRVEVSIVY
jgi:type IX secretion system PorP/SprF family membrane protein